MTTLAVEEEWVLRSLLYAFPGTVSSEKDGAYKPLHLIAGPQGLRLLGLHKSTAFIGELKVAAEAIDRTPSKQVKLGLVNHEFQSALHTVTRQVYQAEPLQLEFNLQPSKLETRLLIGDDRSVRRKVRATDPGIRAVDNLPSFTEAPGIIAADPELLIEARWAFEGATSVDAVEVSLNDEGIRFAAIPDSDAADFSDRRVHPSGSGSTHILPAFLGEAARFAATQHGLPISGIDLHLIDGGLSRIKYALPKADMTYWIAPAHVP